MKEERYKLTVNIGGEPYQVKVLYKDIFKFYKNFSKTYDKALIKARKEKKELIIPNDYFFNTLWGCLEKDGFWIWKKPFRNKKQMINSILYDEVNDIITFISKHVLHFDEITQDAPPEKGKQKKTKKLT